MHSWEFREAALTSHTNADRGRLREFVRPPIPSDGRHREDENAVPEVPARLPATGGGVEPSFDEKSGPRCCRSGSQGSGAVDISSNL